MSFLNQDEEEVGLEAKARSNPSRLSEKHRSKENSLDLHRWHSFKDELIKERKEHSFSSQLHKVSGEHSEPRMHSLILGDKSNSELKGSVASKYVEYMEHYKKTYHELLKKGENDEHGKDGIRLKIHKDQNILLNSTILSSCFGDRSFHEPIHELSNEAEFIEEGESASAGSGGESGFFDENNRESFSKIYNHLERESFSFEKDKMLTGFFEEMKDKPPKTDVLPAETSFDTMENIDRLDTNYFFEKDSKLDRKVKTVAPSYDQKEEHINIVVVHLTMGENKFSDEYILTSRGLVNSKKNTKIKSLVIGRMSSVIEDVRPNDIILPFADKAISRVHCAIVFKHGFRYRKIPRSFLTLLSGKYQKIAGDQCSIKRLTKDLLHRIYSFLRPPYKFYAMDLGSTTGTYKRILAGMACEVKKGDIFMVGNSYQFSANYVNTHWTKTANLNELFQILAEEPEDRTEIHGLTSEQMRKVDYFREKKKSMINEILKEEGDSSMQGRSLDHDALFPMLVFQIENASSTTKAVQ